MTHGARVDLGHRHEGLQHRRRCAREGGAGVDLGQVLEWRARTLLGRCALGDEVGHGAPEPRVARGDGERAGLQSGIHHVGAADAAGRVVTTRVEGALHAVEQHARRRVVCGELCVDVLDDVPRDAAVGGHASRAEHQAGRGAGREQAGAERCGSAEQGAESVRKGRHGAAQGPGPQPVQRSAMVVRRGASCP